MPIKYNKVCVLVAQLCLTLCNPMDCCLLGSSVHKMLQARILEWIAIPFSREIFLTQRLIPGLPHTGRFFTNWATGASPMAQWVKNPPAMQEIQSHGFNPQVRKISLRRKMAMHSGIHAWKIHGQRSLAGYSLKGYKESYMTKHKHHWF